MDFLIRYECWKVPNLQCLSAGRGSGEPLLRFLSESGYWLDNSLLHRGANLFVLGLQLIGRGLPSLWRAICFTQSSPMSGLISSKCTFELMHKSNHHTLLTTFLPCTYYQFLNTLMFRPQFFIWCSSVSFLAVNFSEYDM